MHLTVCWHSQPRRFTTRTNPEVEPRNTASIPGLEPMADLYNSGDLSFVANISTLAHPIAQRDEYLNGTVPAQLCSLSDQWVQ
ncbi:MAG: hypothetical protein M2R45_03959 [Verrucomicrobia subdivision 3 bacterium]|nr:hypothetical protein [Limisphaerales bacterium]MCS1415521.1 hypothetical protein [Limisphaerales bacterium]